MHYPHPDYVFYERRKTAGSLNIRNRGLKKQRLNIMPCFQEEWITGWTKVRGPAVYEDRIFPGIWRTYYDLTLVDTWILNVWR